ncbi:hypothetical protein NIES4103_16070 [Nostoc sp. NIES-4103]|nr:hypothetical protein NIES4103_16070 [Nostoc sp. NIES-4103]
MVLPRLPNDIVNALTDGFAGNGNIFLGNAEDILKGFGNGYFDGSNGKLEFRLVGSALRWAKTHPTLKFLNYEGKLQRSLSPLLNQ